MYKCIAIVLYNKINKIKNRMKCFESTLYIKYLNK